MNTIKNYYYLTKPGIIYGNILTAAAGFLLASRHHINLWLMVATLLGTSLVIGSACVFNNYIDRDLDKRMARTKKRALVLKTISPQKALMFAGLLGMVGFLILGIFTNWLVLLVEMIGFVDYVGLYGYAKRRSVHGTLVGSISGATPILAGYCAARGGFDTGAALVFLIMVVWQMPHFYGIAMYRHADYKSAGLPVLPVVKGMRAAKIQVMVYIVAFVGVVSLLTVYGYTGYTYLVVMVGVSLVWLTRSFLSLKTNNDNLWGRKVFLFSLIVLLTASVMLAVGARLP